MLHEYPKMLYKHGGPHEIHGSKFDHVTVNSHDEEVQAVGIGWCYSTTEALDVVAQKQPHNSPIETVFQQPKKVAKPASWSK